MPTSKMRTSRTSGLVGNFRMKLVSGRQMLSNPRDAATGACTVAVVGPAPGQAGGISSVMSYLESETKADANVRIIFLDTLRNERWSILAFVRVVLHFCGIVTGSKISSRRLLLHLNVSTGGSTIRKWFISRICRITNTPYVVHLHGSKYKQFYARSSPVVRSVVIQLFQSAQSVIVLGKAWHDYVVGELCVPSEQVVIIANGTPALDITSSPPVDTNKVRVVFSGRLSEQKGIPELLLAADRIYEDYKDFELVLMGDSRDDALLAEARSRPYCSYTGWLHHREVIGELTRSDIFTLPSHDEGLPMAMIEAMSLALPVVVTKVGSIEDVINDGQEGFLIEPGNVDQLRKALESLIRDRDMRLQMGVQAQRRWREELDASLMAEKIKHEWKNALLGA